MYSDALETEPGNLLLIVFALALGLAPVIGSIALPELEPAENTQSVGHGSGNVLEVEYDNGTFFVGSATFTNRNDFFSQLAELANGCRSIRFTASGNTAWDEILPVLRDLKRSHLPIKCIHQIIGKEDRER